MISREIRDLLTRGESDNLELSATYAPESVARTAAAFLNSGGGTLVIGAAPGSEDSATGVVDARNVAEQIERTLVGQIEPLAPIAVSVVDVGHQSGLVIVDVPAAEDRPYVYADEVYVRRGAVTRAATTKDVLRMIDRRQREPLRWERQPAHGVELDDLSRAEVLRTANQAREQRFVELGTDPADVLAELGVHAAGRVRNAAVVLFGRDPARVLPQTHVRVARYETERRDELHDNRTFHGNLFELADRLREFVAQHTPVRSSLRGRYERLDRVAYPLGAIREAILNALVHRDYASYSGSVSVSLYPKRFEIWNPGQLPEGVSPAELKQGTVSRPHNPDIAYVCYLRGLVERLGIGARRIVEECRDMGLREPRWEEVGGGVLLTIYLEPLAGGGAPDLNERVLAYLRQAAPGDAIGVAEYQARYAVGRTDRTARADLALLATLGIVRRVGRGPNTRYVRTDLAAPLEGGAPPRSAMERGA